MTLTSYLILKSQVSTILNVVPGLKQFAQKELRVGVHREIDPSLMGYTVKLGRKALSKQLDIHN